MSLVEELLKRVNETMTPEEIVELKAKAAAEYKTKKFLPSPGPQTDAYNSDADIMLYGGAAGGGKALDISTRLPTPTGWTTMGAVGVGDELFDETGARCRVIAATPVMLGRPCFRVRFSDGAEVVADADHLWLTMTKAERDSAIRLSDKWRAKRRAARPSRAKSVSQKPWVSRSISRINRERIHTYLESPTGALHTTGSIAVTTNIPRGKLNHSVAVAGPVQCDKAVLAVDPYLLGAWLGDGTSAGASITIAEAEMLEQVSVAASGYAVRKRASRYSYGITGGLQAILRTLGVLRDKHIPKVYLRASIEQRIALLQGLMDTDGYCAKDGQCDFTNTNERLARNTFELVQGLGCKATLRQGIAKLYGREISPKYSIQFYAPFPCFRLSRKLERQKMRGFRPTVARRYITAVEPVQSVPVKCIQVESQSGLFLCSESFVPTHNSALLVGLAYTKHTRSLICRRQYTDMGELIRFALDEVHRSRDGYRGDPPMRLQTRDGRQIEFFAAAQPGDEQHRQGQPVDLIGIDEAAQFLEEQIVFIMGWLRSTNPNQKCRIVLASNPPLSAEGRWLNEWFAPWIEPDHPNKALPGELRWYVRGENDKWRECAGPEPVQVGFKADGSPRMVNPMSFTFIPSKLNDNPYLAGTGYERQLSNMPEMYRVALLEGNFAAAREDHEKQVIPTQWILEAQKRWTPNPPANSPMCSLGVDVAQGGADATVLAPRYDYWFDKPTLVAGKDTPLGADVAALIFKHIRHRAIVVVDAEGGYGLGAYEHMKGNNIPVVGYKGGGKSTARTKDRLLSFYNKRAEAWWKFREALDPDQPGGSRIALPSDSGLRDDLACVRMAPNYDATTRGIKIESKDDIRKRLGRSPDTGDAVVMAFTEGPTSATHHQIWRDAIRVAVRHPRVIQGYESRRRQHFV